MILAVCGIVAFTVLLWIDVMTAPTYPQSNS